MKAQATLEASVSCPRESRAHLPLVVLSVLSVSSDSCSATALHATESARQSRWRLACEASFLMPNCMLKCGVHVSSSTHCLRQNRVNMHIICRTASAKKFGRMSIRNHSETRRTACSSADTVFGYQSHHDKLQMVIYGICCAYGATPPLHVAHDQSWMLSTSRTALCSSSCFDTTQYGGSEI